MKPSPHTVYLPKSYDHALRFLYEGLKEERKFAISPQVPPVEHRSRITSDTYEEARVSRISVLEIGEDFENVMAVREAEAAAVDVTVYQVWLPLGTPSVGSAVECLRNRGYFLGGLLPRWFDTDGLLMQRLCHIPNWDGIQILLDRSREIFRVVHEDWARSRNQQDGMRCSHASG